MRAAKCVRIVSSATAAAVIAALLFSGSAQAAPTASKPTTVNKNMIVLLKNQHTAVPAGKGAATRRAQAVNSDQASVVADARKLGAQQIKQFSLVNAFSATIASDKVAALRQNPNVAAVVPDLPIAAPVAPAADTAGRSSSSAPGSAIPYDTICSTDPNKPRLEPEALQTMHVAYNDNRPSAAQLETGKGVTVGWIADGIDINNPDFIRNGKTVFSDYQDFSGEGPNAPSGAAEAFGDASSIAAQGNVTYNLNDFAATANPLPKGCYIKIRGVAPGANMVGLKVFGNAPTAPTSRFIGAVQYAVNNDGVDVLNESFGSNPYPDTMDDPISLVNNAAIAAGVSVVASTGDSGVTGTIGSPATSRDVIGVAATTTYRLDAQLANAGINIPAAGVKGWADDNISELSSGGFAQNGKLPDVSAPGELGWAVCSKNTDIYTECRNLNGKPSNLLEFGGTSEASPLTAGTAALVIAAYRKTHGGATPSPALTKHLIVSTSQDLGHPAYQQGSGEVDALAAVKAAQSAPYENSSRKAPTANGTSLLRNTDQLNLTGQAGGTASGSFTVTNLSKHTQSVATSTRSLNQTVSAKSGSFAFNGPRLPTFLNVTGSPRAYKELDFNVPVGADHVTAQLADISQTYTVFLALVDPHGVYQSYSEPQGVANYARAEARYPAPGLWKAFIWANPAYSGAVNYKFTSEKYRSLGTTSPKTLTLAPGATGTVKATFPVSEPGDVSASVQLKTSLGVSSSVGVSVRSLISTKGSGSSFSGTITGGNGRAAGGPAQTNSYYLDVPAGKSALNVGVKLTGNTEPDEVLVGYLVTPDGQTLSARSNVIADRQGNLVTGAAVQAQVRNPVKGRWRFVLETIDPVSGLAITQNFTGKLTFAATPVTASPALPNSAWSSLKAGKPVTVKVKVTNNTDEQQLYFTDARLNAMTDYTLASQVPGDDLQNETLPESPVTPKWLVPSSTSAVTFYANATVPVGLDVSYEYGDPEVYGASNGNSASVGLQPASGQVAPGPWLANVGELGPFAGPAPAGTVGLQAIAHTNAFDRTVTSSTGDFWQTALVAAPAKSSATKAAPAVNGRWLAAAKAQAAKQATPAANPSGPLVLQPGQTGTIAVTITPSGARGSVVAGTLRIDAFDPYGGTASELAAVPYKYRIG